MTDVTQLGKNGKFFVIAGPCVIEGTDFLLKAAQTIKRIADEFGVPLVFKSSYDKANRTSVKGFRGPGLKKGLADLAMIKKKFGIPVLTDIHEIEEVKARLQGSRCASNPGLSFPANQPSFGSGQARKSGQCEEGAIHGALGNGQCGR